MELVLAHKLLQTCVQMYFRTASDLAPEITRFNSHGLVDDLGSMHNILRPETVESLFLFWRTTKLQIYRNWGQRILSAFSRRKTPHGFASLHNVNLPGQVKDDMPSFFIAETLKYLYLLFAPDNAVSLTDLVFSTEAHPLPTLSRMARERVVWKCRAGSNVVEDKHPRAASPPTDLGGTADTAPPGTSCCAEHEELADAEVRCRQELQVLLQAEEPSQPPVTGAAVGDPACWQGDYRPQVCCWPPPVGNMACWDGDFTYERCCLSRAPGGEGHTGRPSDPSCCQEIQSLQKRKAACQDELQAAQERLQAQLKQALPSWEVGPDPACWRDGYDFQACCWPRQVGNMVCWDEVFTYQRCCTSQRL